MSKQARGQMLSGRSSNNQFIISALLALNQTILTNIVIQPYQIALGDATVGSQFASYNPNPS